MIRRIGRILRRILFVCLLLAVLWQAGEVLQPKKYAEEDMPSTATFRDFYKVEPGTLDVVFLGSSHGVRSFVPQELYNNYGLTSYNLSSQEQSIAISYYWLEEALRLHKPAVAVLDTFYVFDYDEEYPLNMTEGAVRLALDPMQMSPVKLNAVREICELDPSQDVLSFLMPVVRFHAAWQTLTKESFQPDNTPGLMGYSPAFHQMGEDHNFVPFGQKEGKEMPMNAVMQDYLERMADLCEENGVKLLLVKTPGMPWIVPDKHNTMSAFAEEHGLDFINFNEYDVYYDGLDFWFAEDNYDTEHANYWGACKLTDYIGNFIVSEYELESHEDSYFEDFNEYYEAWIDEKADL